MNVSIIIVTYQSQDEISKCLHSIYENIIDIEFEIIIIDNSSTDRTIEVVKKEFPYVIVQKNKKNEGFAKANNAGSEIAKGDFLFFLNPDSEIIENTIEVLLSIYNSNPRNGIVAPQIKNIDGSIQPSTGKTPSIFTNLFEAFGLYIFLPNGLFGYRTFTNNENELSTDWVTGACFLVKKEFFDKLNGFDKNFFLYLEDADLCLRLKNKLKKNIIYTTKTSIIHAKAMSSKNSSYRSKLSSYRSKMYYHKKHDNLFIYLGLIPLLYSAVLLKLVSLIILFKEKEQIKSQFKVLFKLL